jgi:hypothetical protein
MALNPDGRQNYYRRRFRVGIDKSIARRAPAGRKSNNITHCAPLEG